MSQSVLVLAIIAIAIVGFGLGRAKVVSKQERLHSLPRYYGTFVALCAGVPAFAVMLLWMLFAPIIVLQPIYDQITPDMIPDGGAASLVMADISRLSDGLITAQEAGLIDPAAIGAPVNLTVLGEMLGQAGVILGSEIQDSTLILALEMVERTQMSHTLLVVVTLATALIGLAIGYMRVSPRFWARNMVERAYLGLLILAAGVAIFTTVGIVLSMLFETINFFGLHDWRDFFFGLNWAPSFQDDSELAILPLLWGTLYISIVALFVAVPIGLFAAIYLSEYASRSVRSFAKPLLEVLAGIPTIVYGLFALIVFGPFLKTWFGDGGFLGVNWMSDARSVATSGIVMGIMLIPFVSSLSDDIINAVPQALRDGSYGLGATQSETIKQVVLPAALPGIVGAILLAASRAIGETMIVVLGAGAIARFSANPLEALTTITTRIVSQLTGDGDFNSPETLVAFALGLTLFVITLGLNIIALMIVRKYREQYE